MSDLHNPPREDELNHLQSVIVGTFGRHSQITNTLERLIKQRNDLQFENDSGCSLDDCECCSHGYVPITPSGRELLVAEIEKWKAQYFNLVEVEREYRKTPTLP